MKKLMNRINPIFTIIPALVFLLVLNPVLAQDNRAEAIYDELENRRKAITYETSTLEMRIIDSRERVRRRTMKMYSYNSGGISNSLIVFEAPADVRGTGFLNLRDGGRQLQYLYLPALARVQSIGGNQRSERFMGSDFSYEDLGAQSPDDYLFELISETDGTAKIKATPETGSQYAYIHFLIDTNKYVLLGADYFGSDGRTVKELRADGFEEVKPGIWRASLMVMKDLQQNRRTELQWSNRTFDEPIPESHFTERHLTRGLQ